VAAAVVADLERVIRLSSLGGKKKKRKKKRGEIVATGFDRYKKNTMRYSFVLAIYSRQNITITEHNNNSF